MNSNNNAYNQQYQQNHYNDNQNNNDQNQYGYQNQQGYSGGYQQQNQFNAYSGIAGNVGNFSNPRNFQNHDHDYDIEKGHRGNDNGYGSMLSSENYNEGGLSEGSRKGFIKKVYSILTAQLFFTVLMTVAAIENTSFNSFLLDRSNITLFYICLGCTLVISIALVCCQSVARSVPSNYILLFAFTLCESYIVAQICVLTNPKLVLIAALLTLVMALALTVYAFTTETDFTMFGGMLFAASAVLCVGGIFMMFTHNNTAHIIFSCIAVILFSVYIIYDTQLLLDSSEHSYSVDDYIIATLQLYIDIINLFLNLLQILSRVNE